MKIPPYVSSLLPRLSLATALGLVAVCSPVAHAQITGVSFTNSSGDGLWNTPANWATGVLPGSSNGAFIVANITATLNADVPSVFDIYIGQGGSSGHLIVNSGASISTQSNVYVGYSDAPTAVGSYIQNGGIVSVGDSFTVGLNGGSAVGYDGLFANVTGGALVVTNAISIGQGSNGFMHVSGGTVSSGGPTRVATGSAQAHSGALVISGGNYVTSAFEVGDSIMSTGSIIIAGNANVSWDNYMDLRVGNGVDRTGAGNLFVVGSNATIKGFRAGFDGLVVNSGAQVKFDFDSIGVSTVDLDDNGSMLTLQAGSILTIDGTLFSGEGTFDLFTYSQISGNSGGQFTTVNFIGFSQTPTLNYGTNALSITVVPEPATVGLVLMGGCMVGGLAYRRGKARRIA